jgi:hypothetical protein
MARYFQVSSTCAVKRQRLMLGLGELSLGGGSGRRALLVACALAIFLGITTQVAADPSMAFNVSSNAPF